jgi:hypothetical protein
VNPCSHGGTCSVPMASVVCTCTGKWDPVSHCNTCSGNWDTTTSCNSCLPGWSGTDCEIQDLCYRVSCPDDMLYCNGTESCDPATGQCIHKDAPTCSAHGTCNESSDSCSCNTGYAGSSCNACDKGYLGYPNCYAGTPTSGSPVIDCSGGDWPGHCVGGGKVYPVTFTTINVVSCTSYIISISGTATNGSVSACAINGNSGSFTYTTGNRTGSGNGYVMLAVDVYGPGGTTSRNAVVTLE